MLLRPKATLKNRAALISVLRMSVKGQKRKLDCGSGMSALRPKAGILCGGLEVS